MLTYPRLTRCPSPGLILSVKSKTFSLAQIKISDVLTEVLMAVRDHHVKMEADFVNTVISILLLEGIGRQLDPGMDVSTRAWREQGSTDRSLLTLHPLTPTALQILPPDPPLPRPSNRSPRSRTRPAHAQPRANQGPFADVEGVDLVGGKELPGFVGRPRDDAEHV